MCAFICYIEDTILVHKIHGMESLPTIQFTVSIQCCVSGVCGPVPPSLQRKLFLLDLNIVSVKGLSGHPL
jgi:hypothetical protein